MSPAVVTRPIRAAWSSVNHSAPPGPETTSKAPRPGAEKGVNCPDVVSRPRPTENRVNQSAPSGPGVMLSGPSARRRWGTT